MYQLGSILCGKIYSLKETANVIMVWLKRKKYKKTDDTIFMYGKNYIYILAMSIHNIFFIIPETLELYVIK